jgi:hypothetical protein
LVRGASGRGLWILLALGLLVEAALVVVGRAVGPYELIGLHGVAVASVAVAVGLLAGGAAGTVAGAGGGLLFVILIAYRAPPDPLLWGVPIVVFYAALGGGAGAAATRLRRAAHAAIMAQTLAREQAERLYAAMGELAAAREPQEVARIILTRGGQALRASGCWMGTMDADRGVLVRLGAFGFDDAAGQSFDAIPLDAPYPSAEVVRSGQPRWFQDRAAYDEAYPAAAALLRDSSFEAVAVLPLLASSGPIGFLSPLFPQPREFSADERELASAFASTAAELRAFGRRELLAALGRAPRAAPLWSGSPCWSDGQGRGSVSLRSVDALGIVERVRRFGLTACPAPVQRFNEWPDRVIAENRMPQRSVRVDRVLVPSSDLRARHVIVADEVGEDALCRPFGDADLLRDVACADLGVACDAEQHVRVVGQEVPVPRGALPAMRIACHVVRSMFPE